MRHYYLIIGSINHRVQQKVIFKIKKYQKMKLLLLTCFIAVSFALNCTNPLIRRRHHQLRPKDMLTESVVAPDDLPVCKPLQGKDVCCGKEAWKELKENFDRVRKRFSKWIDKRRERY